jgi:hypothetical protein
MTLWKSLERYHSLIKSKSTHSNSFHLSFFFCWFEYLYFEQTRMIVEEQRMMKSLGRVILDTSFPSSVIIPDQERCYILYTEFPSHERGVTLRGDEVGGFGVIFGYDRRPYNRSDVMFKYLEHVSNWIASHTCFCRLTHHHRLGRRFTRSSLDSSQTHQNCVIENDVPSYPPCCGTWCHDVHHNCLWTFSR